MKKNIYKKIILGVALMFFSVFIRVEGARTDNSWDNMGDYIKTIVNYGLPGNTGMDVLLSGMDNYLNFYVVTGENGYGFRDNSGTIQWKNNGGSWANIGSGSGEMVYPGAGIALSTGSAWGTSITNNSSNWNTAYGWGNHASAGYLTGVTVDSPLSGSGTSASHLTVDLSSKQDALISATNIKTINSTSLLGSGDISITPFTDAPSDGSTYGRKNGAWSSVVSGSGDVIGPATNSDLYIPQWDGVNSKTLKNGIPTSTFASALGADDNYVTDAEKTSIGTIGNKVTGPASATAEAVAFFDGTTGKLLKDGSTTATPRFARIGLGRAADSSSLVAGTLSSTVNKGFYIGADDAARLPFGFFVTGDAQLRYTVNAGGLTEWGDGTSVGDTNLYRSGANILKTDDTLLVAGSLGATATRVVKGWFTDGEFTNLPTVNGGTLATALSLGTMASETATNYVAKSLFDANTILYATTDNTPAALTVGTNTVVGRVSGAISALDIDSDLASVSANDDTVPSAKATKAMGDLKLPLVGGTMSGNITLGENTSVAYDPAGSADGKYSGLTVAGTAGAALAFGDLVYLDPTDSRWELADANIAAGADGDPRGILGIVVLAAAGDGSATVILLNGIVRADTAFPTLTINAPVYVSETAGDVVVTQPTTADVVIRVLGFAITADEMYFNPSSDYITHT